MSENEFVGMLIGAILVLGSFVTIVLKITKPIQDLNINIVKLTDKLDALSSDSERQDKRITKHGEEIDELKVQSNDHEHRIKNLETHN